MLTISFLSFFRSSYLHYSSPESSSFWQLKPSWVHSKKVYKVKGVFSLSSLNYWESILENFYNKRHQKHINMSSLFSWRVVLHHSATLPQKYVKGSKKSHIHLYRYEKGEEEEISRHTVMRCALGLKCSFFLYKKGWFTFLRNNNKIEFKEQTQTCFYCVAICIVDIEPKSI